MSLASEQSAVLEPHLTDMGQGNGNRYPNPFFDLSQQYTPRTVKELFRWCTYFYYTDPLVHSTLTKISRYPITKLIYEDPDEQVKKKWEHIFQDKIRIKDRLMELNLDLNVYGNCFASVHLPFTRFLVCQNCGLRSNIEDLNWKWRNFGFDFTCPRCKQNQIADPEKKDHISDVPFKSIDDIKVVRWNPENMAIRYNEATGDTHYFYNVSKTLRYQIQIGERDIIQKLPLLFIRAVRNSRLIKLSEQNLFHMKLPTLAEKDIGWGKPKIQAVLKDLYYRATLRRAQEAVANEHIVPFDFLYPQPNSQMDPFVHSDLGDWKNRVEDTIRKHRRDPNYKAVLPVPIGFGRIGGDGKALMLTPELNYLNQIIVGGMGIPQEFLFGGLNFTGSSITLRSLQNDFQHNQSQLLDFAIWLKEKIRIFMRLPDIKRLRFMDFKMADDVQKIQQMISLNAQRKVSDETLLTELGLDFEKEAKKIISEIKIQNEMQDLMSRAQAKTNGETQLITWNYQQKLQELQMEARKNEMAYGGPQEGIGYAQSEAPGAAPTPGAPQEVPQQDLQAQGQQAAQQAQAPSGTPEDPMKGQGEQSQGMNVDKMVDGYTKKLLSMEQGEAQQVISQVKQEMPQLGQMLEEKYNQAMMNGVTNTEAVAENEKNINMTPMPEKGAPRRSGVY